MDADSEFWTLLPVFAFVSAVLWELLAPKRVDQRPDGRRWGCNLGLLIANSIVLGLIAGWLGGIAVVPRFELLEKLLPDSSSSALVTWAARVAISFSLLDFSGYFLHRLYHRVPMLWRFHEVHHSDTELDCTTGVRHHIVELAVTAALLQIGALLIGVAAPVFAAYGTALVIAQFFQHSNTRWPSGFERALGHLFVTPRLHAVHHSNDPRSFDTNFGIICTVWDRCFGTLRVLNDAQSDGLTFGLRNPRLTRAMPWSLIAFPFRRK